MLVDNLSDKKDHFITLLKSTKRDGIDELIKWLEESDFFYCPASARFHGSYRGGLLEHSLNVCYELKRITEAYPEIQTTEDSIILVSLLHDVCKANLYVTEKRNRKNEETGRWESYDAYTYNEKFCYGGHGSKSVYIVQKFIDLTPDEAVAINCHMGAYSEDPKSVGKAYEQRPFAWALHVADEAACYIKEVDRV